MVTLANFEKKDFDQLIHWVDSERLMINWAGSMFSFPLTHKSLTWYIKDTNDVDTSNAFVYKVIDEDSSKTIGHISLGGISKKNRSGRITRVLVGDTGSKGKGFCRQMISAISKFGFEDLKLHRISLGVYDFNLAAIKCYQSAGFVTEGITRDTLLVNGEWWSLVEMSMLEDEWRALHQKNEAAH